VQLWDVETEKLLHTFQLEKPGSDVFFFDAGKKILTSDYGTVTVFDVPTHASDAKHFKDHRAMAMMPDGKRFLVYTQDQAGRALEIWDAFTAKLLQKFPVAIDPIQPAKISPDEKWALLPDPRGGQKGIDDGTILIWDLSKGEIRTSLSREKQIYSPVAFTPDSKHFAAQHIDAEKRDNEKYSLRLYDVPTAKFLRTLAPSLDAGFIAFSPDGKELVILDPERMKLQEGRKPHVFDTGLRRLQVETGKQLYSVRIPTEGGVVAVLSPDASRLFLGSGDSERLRLEIWDTVQGKKLRTLQPKRK